LRSKPANSIAQYRTILHGQKQDTNWTPW